MDPEKAMATELQGVLGSPAYAGPSRPTEFFSPGRAVALETTSAYRTIARGGEESRGRHQQLPPGAGPLERRTGWTLGTGIEVMMRQNCLIRVEYRFADYGHADHTFFGAAAGDRLITSEALKTQTLLVGMAWKLGTGTPIIARH